MENIPSIIKFACDFRKNIRKWDLPFIRLGDAGSDSKINIHDDFYNDKYRPSMSEMDKIFWVSQNIHEFGNPDFVGFCHYRRFYAKINYKLLDIQSFDFNRKLLLYPEEEVFLINNNNAVGSSMFPILVLDDSRYPSYKYIWEQMYYFLLNASKTENTLVLSAEENIKLFDKFLEFFDDNFKLCLQQAFEKKENYVCNIFTLKRDVFTQFSNAAMNSLIYFNENITDNIRRRLHPRYLGFYCERLLSCYLHALQMNGNKIMHFPLLTVNGSQHNKVIIDDSGKCVQIIN